MNLIVMSSLKKTMSGNTSEIITKSMNVRRLVVSNTTQTSKTLDSYSKARMEIMVKDELPNLLQDIQRTYIYDFMPETVHGENHIRCSYCEQDFKDYADDDYLFYYQEEEYCSIFCVQLTVYSKFNDYFQRVKEKVW